MVDESSAAGSITELVERLKSGDAGAAQPLWEHYFSRLVELARHKLRGSPHGAADEEDVALSAFDSFFRGAAAGRFPALLDRDGLWRLLVVITTRKALKTVRDERREKRGGGAVLDEAALLTALGSGPVGAGLDLVAGAEPTPEFAAMVADGCRQLLDVLGDDDLRSVALWKMEGYSNAEIATRLERAPRSIERMLHLIRAIWAEETGS